MIINKLKTKSSIFAYVLAVGLVVPLLFNNLALASPTINEYPVTTARSYPEGIALGSDGNIWFTEQEPSANKIGKITPSGTITEYPVTTASSEPEEIALGSDGNMWFTESSGNNIGLTGNFVEVFSSFSLC